MLKPLLTRFLQRIITQNTWAKPLLQPFSGKTMCVQVTPVSANITVLEDGSLCMAGESVQVDATMTIPPTALLRLLAKDESTRSLIRIEGDSEFATAFGKVMQAMSWDVEEDLSRVMGDIAAHKAVQTSRSAMQESKKQIINVAEMLTEFWQEEQPLLAKKHHVAAFNREVDALRDDVARLEKRLEKLTH